MTVETAGIIAACTIITLAINIGLRVWNGGWNLRGQIADLRKEWGDADDTISAAQTENLRMVRVALQDTREEFWKELRASDARVGEMEKYVRDTFVRRDSFYTMVGEVRSGMEALGQRLEKRLDRIEDRIAHNGGISEP